VPLRSGAATVWLATKPGEGGASELAASDDALLGALPSGLSGAQPAPAAAAATTSAAMETSGDGDAGASHTFYIKSTV